MHQENQRRATDVSLLHCGCSNANAEKFSLLGLGVGEARPCTTTHAMQARATTRVSQQSRTSRPGTYIKLSSNLYSAAGTLTQS